MDNVFLSLPDTQRAALLDAVRYDELMRTRAGYVGRAPDPRHGPGPATWHTARAVFALARAGLLERSTEDSESRYRPTAEGRAAAAGHQVHVKHDAKVAA